MMTSRTGMWTSLHTGVATLLLAGAALALSPLTTAVLAAAAEVSIETLTQRGRAPLQTAVLVGRPLDVQWRLERLTSEAGEDEMFERVRDPRALGIEIEAEARPLSANATELRFTFRNTGEATHMLRSATALGIPGTSYDWWNGYLNQDQPTFDPDDLFLSKWFPLNAALNATAVDGQPIGVGLGVNPSEVYSRIDTGRTEDGANHQLELALPFVLDPGQSFELSHVVTAFSTRLGYRDAIQNYYDLFPKAYEPADGIDPRVIGPQTTYMAWRPNNYGLEHPGDLIRRFTDGAGGWEWCYAPMVRGGDWATTDKWTVGWENPEGGKWTQERVDRYRERVQERLDDVERYGSAPMYYVNVMYAERTLIDEHFPGTVFERRDRKSWGQITTTRIYPGWNAYGDLFNESVDLIPERFPQARGIGWDSAFGHFVLSTDVDGVEETPRRSFDKGQIIAVEGAAHAALLDRNHEHENGGHRMANAVNLKLVSPYFTHARTDVALYEGAPNQRPERFLRVESMRGRLGTKPIAWHKHLLPAYVNWIEWDRLSPEQIEGAFRQIHDDALLLSYYWGAFPAPNMPALGVERTFEHMPTLASLLKQGWQPSARVDVEGSVLTARYGQGLGACIVLINPTYESQEVSLTAHAQQWDGNLLVLAAADEQEVHSTLADEQVTTQLTVPAHEVVILRVVGTVPADDWQGQPELVLATRQGKGDRGEQSWSLTGSTEAAAPLPMTFWQAPQTASVRFMQLGQAQTLEMGQDGLALDLDTSGWQVDFQSINENTRQGRFYVDQFPEVHVDLQPDEVVAMGLVEAVRQASPPVQVVIDASVTEPIQRAARQITSWFEAYTTYEHEKASRPTIVTAADADGEAAQIRLVVDSSFEDDHGAIGRIHVDSDKLILVAQSEQAVERVMHEWLALMDDAYPYYGRLPEGDPYLEAAGLAGEVLKAAPPEHVAGRSLVDWLDDAGLMPE